jgi:hypothetical protein
VYTAQTTASWRVATRSFRPGCCWRTSSARGATTTHCRSQDVSQDADRDLEREVNVFGAELLMPEEEDHKRGDENQPGDRGAKLISARYEATAATTP